MRCTARALGAVLAGSLGTASCAGLASSGAGLHGFTASQAVPDAGGSHYISHVVVVIQENRSFDDFFATFPGADGATQGRMKTPSGSILVNLHRVPLAEPCDFSHSYGDYVHDYDGGAMDGFNLEYGGPNCLGQSGAAPYQYVDPSQIAPYWDIAQQYVLADHMFTTQGSGSFTGHQALIAGGTTINPEKTKTLVDYPSAMPWGCDAPPKTVTSMLVAESTIHGPVLKYRYRGGPFPCLGYRTMRDLLDAKGISWKYYSPPEPVGTGAFWNAFDAIEAVRRGPQWSTNIASPTTFFIDVDERTLPAVSWIVPTQPDSDHPGKHAVAGPSWVASIVNAIGESTYWQNTAVIVVWDDWGGFYDHVPPPFFDRWGGLGFRVPMLVVSPYALRGSGVHGGYVSHTQYEFGSILKFIEHVWSLGSLHKTDERATSIIDCFDFSQAPRKFNAIPSKYSKEYFLHQPPSNEPVDTE